MDEEVGEWTAAGERELPFSTIISIAWLDGSLACGVEFTNGDHTNAGVLFLNTENQQDIKFIELSDWDSLCSVKRFLEWQKDMDFRNKKRTTDPPVGFSIVRIMKQMSFESITYPS